MTKLPQASSSTNALSPWAILDQAKALPVEERHTLLDAFLAAGRRCTDDEWTTLSQAGQPVFGYRLETVKPLSQYEINCRWDEILQRWAERWYAQQPDEPTR